MRFGLRICSSLKSPVYLIDASIYFFRAYFTLPDSWFTVSGDSVNGVLGYARFLMKFLASHQPESVAVAFDESLGTCFRHSIYPHYKQNRVLPDDNLVFQFSACKKITEALGVRAVARKRYEADDIIAAFARKARAQSRAVRIISCDKDLGQLLLQSSDCLWDVDRSEPINGASFADKYGVKPQQMADYLALVGDPVDDIPGVPGVGANTAIALLKCFDSLDHLYANLSKVARMRIRGAATLAAKLELHKSQVMMAKELTRLHDNVNAIPELTTIDWKGVHFKPLMRQFDKLGLTAALAKPLEALRVQARDRI